MKTILPILFISASILQICATIAGLHYWGIPIILIVLFFWIGGIPLLGTIAGICGAIYAWHWPIIISMLLFALPWIIIGIIAFLNKKTV